METEINAKTVPQKMCSACGEELKFLGTQRVELVVNKRKNIFNMSDKVIKANVYQCPQCGKLEFYNSIIKNKAEKPPLPTEAVCPRCARTYETVYGHCPYCGWSDDE